MSILLRPQWRSSLFGLAFVLLGLSGIHHLAIAQSGKLLSANTKKGYSKSNQSKVFFHDGKWWALAFETKVDQWFIWQYADNAWIAKSPAGNLSSSARPDVVLNAASNRLYILFASSNSASDFYRLSYSAGAWKIDAGFPRVLTVLGEGESKTPASLSRAINGELWIFRISEKVLQALRSNDEGFTWSGIITVKSGLNYKRGLTDAQAFSAGGKNYIGVAYGETGKEGVKTRFGFLYHRDGDPETSWADESPALTMMGKENSTNSISLAVDAESHLYLFTQNDSAAGVDPRNTLYKRNAATGLWQAFKVNTSALWTSPAIAVQGSSKLFLMGINTGTGKGEYKIVSITKENLAAATMPNLLFDNNADFFADLSAPAHAVDATTQLMVCAENTTAGKIWYNHLEIGGSTGGGGGGVCTPQVASGPAAIAGTRGSTSDFYKPNQNKVFFHGGVWWIAALSATESEWFLWKKMGVTWIKTISLGTPASIRPDCHVDSPNNKLYILTSQNNFSEFLRLTYNPDEGLWALDPGFPVTLNGFAYQSENPAVLARARNGDLWAFVSRAGALLARRSSNGGQTWTADVKIKTFNVSLALCDAVTFTSNGQNYVGVGYGEDTDPKARYGFVMHKDGDADNVWADETSQLIMPLNTQADDHIAMAVSASQEAFMVVKTKPGGSTAPGINLYKRGTNGGWTSIPVFKASQETRPAVVIDETNNELYIFTTLLSSPRFGRYKKCLIGEEASLATAIVKPFFQTASDDFYNVSTPSHRVNYCTGLMIAAENNTNAKTWYQIFSITGGNVPPPAIVVGNVTVTPTPINQNAAYTIPLTLGATESLVAGNTITVVWPNGTTIPATIANTAVSVNGVNAISVTTTPAMRQAVVTIPVNIAGGTIATLTFAAAAGIINPATAANYSLMAKTSVQPVDAISPLYAIGSGVITPVTIGTITASPDTVSRPASYTIPITLGATGGLSAGVGTITITWPNDFTLPATIVNAAVTVNGANASAVTINVGARQTTVTIPSNIAGGAAVNLLFLKTAGIKNATTAGDYILQAQTSAQSLNANSPTFNLKSTIVTPPPGLTTGRLLASRTKAPFDKSSQSKVFYLGGKWWTAALDSVDAKWYLFSYNGSTWTRGIQIDSRSAARADFTIEAASNRLYALLSQGTTTYFNRLVYTSDSWSREAQVPLVGFEHGAGANVVTITRAKNGFLWIFRINNGMLETQVSMDNGNSWSSTITLKSGLAGLGGQTDAATFGSSVGVFYAMNVTTIGARFGFLKHSDSDPIDKWTDESSQISFFGAENAENWISANATSDDVVYAITRNKKGGAVDPTNTLHKRSASGVWSKFKVNLDPVLWTSPTLALDASNKRLYVMGIRTGTPAVGEYKWCALGNEGALENAPAKEMFKNNAANFGHVSAPLAAVTNATGLLVVASNVTRDDLWFNHINLSLAKNPEIENAALLRQRDTEIDNFSAAQVYPNPFNPSTSFRFAVKEPSNVTLQIFNLRGELVRTLIDGEYNRGVHERRWHGRDNTGNQVASGLYFYRLQIGNKMFSGRMQMLK